MSTIVGSSLYLQGLNGRRREILWWCFTFLIGLILIHPNFGADVGGGITALMTLGAFVLAGTWDLVVNCNSMSHLGQLLLSVRNHGLGVFTAMVIRKISLNLRLISSTPLIYKLA